MPEFDAFPGMKSWPGSSNIHLENGKAMPTWDHAAMTNSADVLHYFLKEAIETVNPSGNPRQYAFANLSAFYFEDGSRAGNPDKLFTDTVQGAQIIEGPPYSNGVGTKKLMVSFGNSSTTLETTRLRTLTTDTSPWTAAVGTGTATQATMFKFLAMSDGSIIADTGSAQSGTNLGRCSLGEYFIGKCKRGDDPTLAASYGNIQACNTPEWPIIDLAPLYDSFVVGKGDGAYFWDDRAKRFRPILSHIKYRPHALNCKGLTAGQNCVWIPLADGRVFRFDGSRVDEDTPWKSLTLPRDVLTTRATAIADRGDVIAIRTEAFYNSVVAPRANTAMGMRVFTSTGAGPTITEITTNVVDGSIATGANLGTFGTTATDKVVIGLNQPAEGFIFRVPVTGNTNASAFFVSPQCSDGASGWTSLGTIVDYTSLGTAASLGLTGYPPGGSQACLGWTSKQSYDLSKTDTFNAVTGLYWYRFAVNAAAAMTSPVVAEIEPIQSRAGLPNGGLIGTTTNYTHRDAAGGIGHVYIGRRIGAQTQWVDEYAVDDNGGVWAMAWTTCRSGTMTNGGQPLLLWGRSQQTVIAESNTRDPSRTPYPKLVQLGTGKVTPRHAFRNIQMGAPTLRSRVNLISVQCEGVQPTDQMSCYAWWDNEDRPVEWDVDYGSPMIFKPGPGFQTEGRLFNFDLLFSDASQNDPMAPYWYRVIVDYDDVPGAFVFSRDSAWATPELT